MVKSGSTKSISSFESLILLPLPASSRSSASRREIIPLALLLSLLPCHSCQALALPAAQAWVAVCFHGSSLWVTTSFLVGAEGSLPSGYHSWAPSLAGWPPSSPLAPGAQTAPPSLPSLPGGCCPSFPAPLTLWAVLSLSFGTSALRVWGVLLTSQDQLSV